MLSRIIIFLCNIFCPPLAVLFICGPGMDFWINCLLFLLGVLPSHIHGMYISYTYFSRSRKVRRGRLPGRPRGGISSEKVQNGGASKRQLEQIAMALEAKKMRQNRRG
jgi:uncharacterized membrane protein YqaE (UPF0057 family)